MPNIDLSILNQRQTPAFYADTLANRPAAGFVGRIFVSTDTFAFYRDNGTSWDLIGGPGTGTITGSGANGQVSYWNGASTITGSNDLFFDAVNGHLGIGTITPGTALDVKHDQNTVVQLEQVTATNDTRIAFINNGVGLWRLGSFYNAGANDFGLFDIAAAAQPVTVKRTTGQVLIGTSTVGSGKLVVASSTGDNGVQIVGASAPSLRIDNAESGPTKRAGFGISTATNNFIQGSADRDFCMFNGSTTASPILFGIYDAAAVNVQEAARISPARNFIIGSVVDAGYKLDCNGAGRFTGVIYADNSIRVANAIIGTNSNNLLLSSNTTGGEIQFYRNALGTKLLTLDPNGDLLFQSGAAKNLSFYDNTNTNINAQIQYDQLAVNSGQLFFKTNDAGTLATRLTILNTGNIGIGISTPTPISTFTTLEIRGATGAGIKLGKTATAQFNIHQDGTDAYFNNTQSGNIYFYTSDAERGRWTTSGNLKLGTGADNGNKLQVTGDAFVTSSIYQGTATNGGTGQGGISLNTTLIDIGHPNGTASGDSYVRFIYNAGVIGSITQAGTTGVAYNIVSDYRLKEDLKDYLGLDLISKIKTYDFSFKSNKSRMYGVMAHELQEFLPYAVTGQKDGKDMQQVDYSKIVPILIKAIQELNTKIENLK